MIAVSSLHAAISAHRAAYDAFQIAPEGEDSENASCEMLDALDALVMAACAFPIIGRTLPEGAGALLAHLQWWLAEEAVNAVDYQPSYGVLLGRASDLAAVLAGTDGPDPIFAALAAVEAADRESNIVLDETAGDESDEANARFEDVDRRRAVVETAFAETLPTTMAGLAALVRRYVTTAGTVASGEIEHVARALARVPAPQILPRALAPPVDPIFALIAAADVAGVAHTKACADLDEDDDAQMRACNQAAADAHDALMAVRLAMPITVEGLHALAAFYVRDADLYGRDWESLGHLAQALLACDSTGQFSGVLRPETMSDQWLAVVIPPGENDCGSALSLAGEKQAALSLKKGGIRGTSTVPDQAQVAAAWRALSAEMRDRIGIIATDMTFQSFVSGDGYGPKDQPVPGRSKRAQEIRGEASDASCRRLTELHTVIEDALPILFGSAGANPDWAIAMGAKR